MFRLPWLGVAALLGAAVSAPAQLHVQAEFGRHFRAGVTVNLPCPPRYPVPVQVPVPMPVPMPVQVLHEPHGHWETVCEQVLVPGYWAEHYVPPTWGWVRGFCGQLEWGIVDPGGCRRTWVPPRYETRTRQVWVPDCEPRYRPHRRHRW